LPARAEEKRSGKLRRREACLCLRHERECKGYEPGEGTILEARLTWKRKRGM
jgi:hypothetical protein